jgi:hypothetical protein
VNHPDRGEFATALAGLMDLYARPLSPASITLWWGAFAPYPLPAVKAAFSRYVQDPDQGRYPPTPAAVLGCLPSTGPARLSADEAWALALGTFDEAATVCATDEMLEAVAVAAPVWAGGDKIGARMAFKGAYERIVAQRRAAGTPPRWSLSLGWDAEQRAQVAQEALRLARLPLEQVQAYLPAPPAAGPAAAVAGLLTGKVVDFPAPTEAPARQRLAALRAVIAGAARPSPDRDPAAERQDFAQRQREATAALERLQAEREIRETA